jgi:hypothetical protein
MDGQNFGRARAGGRPHTLQKQLPTFRRPVARDEKRSGAAFERRDVKLPDTETSTLLARQPEFWLTSQTS